MEMIEGMKYPQISLAGDGKVVQKMVAEGCAGLI
jgi:hypothetical protein